jgi:hypothetical protein
MGAGLSQENDITGSAVFANVDSASVSELQRFADAIRKVVTYGNFQCGQVRSEDTRGNDPRGSREDWATLIRLKGSVWSVQGEDRTTIGARAGQKPESAVANEDGSLADAQISENVGTSATTECDGQFVDKLSEIGVIGRVYGDKFSTVLPQRVLRVC